MEQLGLKGILEFENKQALAAMSRTSKAFAGMEKHTKRMKKGMSDLRAGFSGIGIATAAVGAGVVSSVKKFADFEGQMSAVKAVLGKEAKPQFEALEATAMKLGASTSFTSMQAAEAMENLARAGFSADEVMSTISPTLNAAAADGLDLATAADIVASNIRAFGLEAKDATMVADTLAYVSSKTNTNMAGLQEGLKYVGPVAKNMGISVQDTAASLGALADIGLKGTLAGTGLKNALLKIAQSAKYGKVPVGKFKAEIVKTESGNVDLAKTMVNVVNQLQKIKDPLKRAQASMGLLGMRGMGAAAAFEALGKKKGGVSGLFEGVNKQAKDTAKAMKEMRLSGFHGDMVRLSSATYNFQIALAKLVAPKISGSIKALTDKLGDPKVGKALADGVEAAASTLRSALGVVKGVAAGIHGMLNPFDLNGPTMAGAVKLTLQVTALAASLKIVGGLFSRMTKVAVGSFRVMSGALGAAKTGLGGVTGLLSKKFPKLAKVLPGGLKKLAGAANIAEKMTAQPVRVVNFDEAGGGLAPSSWLTEIGGKKGGPPPTPWAALGKGQKLGRAAGAAAKWGGGALLAGMIGYEVGTFLDRSFGISDKLSNIMLSNQKQESMMRVAQHEEKITNENAYGQLDQLIKLSQAGKTLGGLEKGKRFVITRELAEERLRKGLLRGKTEAEQRDVIESLRYMIDMLPSKVALISKNQPVVINMNGREVAKANAEAKRDANIRRGSKVKPGSKTKSKAM